MKLTFLGTRGYIDARNRRHYRHSSLLVSYYGRNVMIDAGEDWLGLIDEIAPDAVVLTHAHPDHAFGLRDGAPCPVAATEVTWEAIGSYPIETRSTIDNRTPIEIAGIGFEAFPVEHSTVAPAVGFRVTAGRVSVFYVPDVVYIQDRGDAMADITLFIGDGATLKQAMVRKQDGALVGHAPMQTQLTWCSKEGVPRAAFTHCGTAVVEDVGRTVEAEVRRLGAERGVAAEIAHDGMEVLLR
jgi:phosphoribosyl 1,2-cyclic phosphodiesterase